MNIFHREQARPVIAGKDARRRAGRSSGCGLEPQALVAVALDRRLPALGDPQAGQRAFDAHLADFPDFGRDASRQHLEGRRFIS